MYQGHIKPVLKKVVKGYARDWWWEVYGRTLKRSEPGHPVQSLLFICKGNICRSPFAEHIAEQTSTHDGLRIASAGLHVTQAQGSPEEAIFAARKFGVNLSEHASQQVDEAMMDSFDMILAMEAKQYNALRSMFSAYREKIHLLPLFNIRENESFKGYRRYNIPDPYGKPLREFEACFERIQDCVQNLLNTYVHSALV
jgi:protein-tyrosine phosphatase